MAEAGQNTTMACLVSLPGFCISDEKYSSVRVDRRSSTYQACSAGRWSSVIPVLVRSARRE
jgi:hypothetical protein